MRKIILASASPRRRELLAAAGVIFQICVSEGEEKITAENPDEIDCYIAYDANVKVGINMEEVTFKINEEKKTVTPVLPKIEINIATLDENSISYIPKNPDLSLKEVITLCKEDAMNEANHSDKLYETAQENLESVIEALLSPILEHEGYSIQW